MAVDLHPSPLRYAPDVGQRSFSMRQTASSLDALPPGDMDFVRGESGMIDRAPQDVTLEQEVVLTGLVPQLTTPSRDHGNLVDIWFGVRWRERSAEWEASFARVAKDWRPDPHGPSFFDLFSYSASSGLIAARRVSADAATWRQVEDQARLLVGRVNREVEERRMTPPSASDHSRGWTLRVREAGSGLRASLRWLGEPKHALPAVVPKLPIQISPTSQTSR
jgi:hypothetical protein